MKHLCADFTQATDQRCTPYSRTTDTPKAKDTSESGSAILEMKMKGRENTNQASQHKLEKKVVQITG